VRDTAGFGAHYARTFAVWRERFAGSSEAVAALGLDDTFQRTWDLYLAFRQASFAGGYLDVRHLVLERTDEQAAEPEVAKTGADDEQAGQASVPAEPRGGGPSDEPMSRYLDLGGQVHYADYGGPPGTPPLVCVHGIGGSGVTWAPIAPALARSCRVLAIDLAGFGRSKGNGLPATLLANQELLHQFLLNVADGPAVLVGHSMGGTVAAMVAAQHPEAVSGLVLINPAVPWVMDELDRRLAAARATLMHAFKTGTWSASVHDVVSADAGASTAAHGTESVITKRLLEQYVSGAKGGNWSRSADADTVVAARSLASTLFRRREFAAMLSSITVPVLWLHGEDDPAVPVGAAHDHASLRPAWQFHVAKGVGHEIQREVPEWTIGHIRSLVDHLGIEPAR